MTNDNVLFCSGFSKNSGYGTISKYQKPIILKSLNILLFIFTATLPQLEFLDGTPIEKSKRIQAVQDLYHIKLMIHSGLRIEKIVQ